ncbi:cupredoxin domain-containing protein [Neptunomonas marina]|nr:cupredoxin domain-containing protein [Neptunomonas marina]
MWLVNLLGLGLVALIAWWFWGQRAPETAISKEEAVTIKVAGGVYTPSVIHARVGQPLTLNFIREDQAPCAEVVIFEGLDLSLGLPLNETVSQRITPPEAGTYPFSCQMQMYRGQLIVT